MMLAEKWADALLEEMREHGDPLADTLIADVMAVHGLDRLNQIMQSLVHNADIVTGDMPEEIVDWLTATSQLPAWADEDLMQQGQAFFNLHWPNIVTLLFCASLPSAYAAHKGAQVLWQTGRLTDQVHRRIFETAQFILDVMAPGGFNPNGMAIRASQKVRLIHASIRYYILNVPHAKSTWNPEWGLPINQEDMAGTLMTFSIQILQGLQRLGIPVTDDEAEAYLHAWKVVGHIMGVNPELIPANVEAGFDLAYTIFDRQRGPSAAGEALTDALLAFLRQQIPGRLLDGLPATIMRYCIDDNVADMLGVPRSNWTIYLLWLEEKFWRLLDRLEIRYQRRAAVVTRYSHALLQGLVTIERGGNRPIFQIPSSLRAPM